MSPNHLAFILEIHRENTHRPYFGLGGWKQIRAQPAGALFVWGNAIQLLFSGNFRPALTSDTNICCPLCPFRRQVGERGILVVRKYRHNTAVCYDNRILDYTAIHTSTNKKKRPKYWVRFSQKPKQRQCEVPLYCFASRRSVPSFQQYPLSRAVV